MLLDINIPPGIYRNGTEYQSKGRWYDANLMRFFQGARGPVGGWRTHSTSAATGKGRAIATWRADDLTAWCAIATEQKLYAMTQAGVLNDVTPAGFTTGIADAVAGGGYGTGAYGGAWPYGSPGLDTTQIQDATVASLDTFGQNLLFCTADDGKIYQWQRNVGVVAAAVSGAPTARALMVTDEKFLFALGAASVPRRVQWPDQGTLTTWSPLATNQAGSFDLQTDGKLMLGRKVRGSALLLTDIDAFTATYIGGTLVYSFTNVGRGCGASSQNCLAAFNGNAAWMGKNGFWFYNGFVQALPCEVQDRVFGDINGTQISKVSATLDSFYGEVTWFYPSGSSAENDSYVTWNYRENHWTIGKLGRTAGCDRGSFGYPLRIGTDSWVYDHEVAFAYADHGASALVPYLESGPFEVGDGDNVMYATQLIPDEANAGDVTVTFKAKYYPNGTEYTYGPYTLTEPTDVRFSGRQFKARYTGAQADAWRAGNFRLDVVQGGTR